MTFFKTIFKSKEESSTAFTTSAPSTRRYADQPSDREEHYHHPLFRDTELIKKVKTLVKKFELCVRNFEETYIAMIKDLQLKTFKLSVENNNNNQQ